MNENDKYLDFTGRNIIHHSSIEKAIKYAEKKFTQIISIQSDDWKLKDKQTMIIIIKGRV